MECPIRKVLNKYFSLISQDKDEELPPINIVTDLKRDLIEAALEVSNGHKGRAAEILNMNRTTFLQMSRMFSNPPFKKSFMVGRHEIIIRSDEEIPEGLMRLLVNTVRRYHDIVT